MGRRGLDGRGGSLLLRARRGGPTRTGAISDEQSLLERARRGEQDAFAQLVGPYQAQLRAHCYRMLGSLADADDALQDTLLRAWRGLKGFEARSSFRSWLYTVATNACLRAIEKRPRRVLPVDYGAGADPRDRPAEALEETPWLEPYPDSELGLSTEVIGPSARYELRESVELAFAAALQHLPARQRAVLVLREVLGFSAQETAELLGTTSVSVDSALQRARKTVEARVPPRSQQQVLRVLGDSRLSEMVQRFASAWEHHDVGSLVSLLAEDAKMAMPPQPSWYQGVDAISTFLGLWALSPQNHFLLLPISASGQPALAAYMRDRETGAFQAESIIVLGLRDGLIGEITAFRNPELFEHFALPAQAPA